MEQYGTLNLQVARGDYKTKKTIILSRFILGVIDPCVDVDHINRDSLDNRKENLRPCSHAENLWNTDAKGIYYCTQTGKWRATVMANGKRYSATRVDTYELAELERAKLVREYRGYEWLNARQLELLEKETIRK